MSENPIAISMLNDFIFCPVSIYFHALYGDSEQMLYQERVQLNGKNSHKSIDTHTYSTSVDVIQGIDVYCEKYNLVGKIDLFYKKSGILVERKKKVNLVYDGFIFQLYAQYYSLQEMGYDVKELSLHSMDDNKNYLVPLPKDAPDVLVRFEEVLRKINNFDMQQFIPADVNKCIACIYRYYCDRSLA